MNKERMNKDNNKTWENIIASRQDWANYIGYHWNANRQIQIMVELDGELDINCLKNAVRLSISVEPILGCCFVEDEVSPYWRRLDNIDEIEWCTVYEVQEKKEVLKRVLSMPLEFEERQIQVIVIRSKEGDTLCIKLNHACCDGGGVKYYVHLLADIYSSLHEGKDYTWNPDTTEIRDSSSVFKAIGITDPKSALKPQLAALKPTWAFPYKEEKVNNFAFSICRIDKSKTKEIHSYGRSKGITMNDIILTAFYRAMFFMVSPEYDIPMEICVTVDLRRYLKDIKGSTVCNLSGVENNRLAFINGENFTEMLERVALSMNKIKSDYPGINSAASIEMMADIGYKNAAAFIKNAWEESKRNGKSTINLSNMGNISDYPLKFGSNNVIDAFMATPVFKAPSFMLGVSSYNNILTFTVGYCEPEVNKEAVETFLSILEKQLLLSIE